MNRQSSRMIPVDDHYPVCRRTDATLAIYHVDPDVVTERIGLIPTSSAKVGGPILLGGRDIGSKGRIHSWLLSSEKNGVTSKDLRTHMDWLLSKLEPAAEQIQAIQMLPGAKMQVQCPFWTNYEAAGPTLWPEQMLRLGKLNLECVISFTFFDLNHEEKEKNDVST